MGRLPVWLGILFVVCIGLGWVFVGLLCLVDWGLICAPCSVYVWLGFGLADVLLVFGVCGMFVA